MRWEGFLEAAPVGTHAVQIYDGLGELAGSVGRFLDAGFRTGEPAILISTAEHQGAFVRELEHRGWTIEALEASGLLVRLDAAQTLESFMSRGSPSAGRFAEVVGGAVDALARRTPDRTIRAFGEMVDLLWQRGQQDAAVALERLWNELAQTRAFALLCGYHLDIFDIDVQTAAALPAVLHEHTHRRPVADAACLADAVDRALTETVGPSGAGAVYLQVAEQVPRTSVPRAHAVLAWLSARDRTTAERVLARARLYYASLRNAAPA